MLRIIRAVCATKLTRWAMNAIIFPRQILISTGITAITLFTSLCSNSHRNSVFLHVRWRLWEPKHPSITSCDAQCFWADGVWPLTAMSVWMDGDPAHCSDLFQTCGHTFHRPRGVQREGGYTSPPGGLPFGRAACPQGERLATGCTGQKSTTKHVSSVQHIVYNVK